MSLLTDTNLKEIIVRDTENASDENLIIEPYSKECLTPVGYDLRVGKTVSVSNKRRRQTLKKNDSISIDPGATALITTLENIIMPKARSISGLIESKVTKVSKGLSHISTTVDPDWEGHLLIALHNHSNEKISLEYAEQFCTIIFIKNSSPSEKPCEKRPGRVDVFLDEFDEEAEKITKRKTVLEFLPPILMIIIAIVGYLIFENSIGFSAMVVLGVAITQYISTKFVIK